jgi:hypothetical protein
LWFFSGRGARGCGLFSFFIGWYGLFSFFIGWYGLFSFFIGWYGLFSFFIGWYGLFSFFIGWYGLFSFFIGWYGLFMFYLFGLMSPPPLPDDVLFPHRSQAQAPSPPRHFYSTYVLHTPS